ncbi:MAG: energy transducer TonB [Flavobacterium sp.]
MKKIFFTIFIVLVSQIGMAQETANIPNQEPIYSSAGLEKQPEFPGGFKEFGLYVQRHYMYPNVTPLKGRVFVEFVIEMDGSIADIKVIRDLGYGTGEEAMRLMKNCPKWIPGMLNGRPIRVRYSLPIAIDLH